MFLSGFEASLCIQDYNQSDKNHSLLIFHFEKSTNSSEKVLAEHEALDGSTVKFSTSYEYICISLPNDKSHKFYDSFDLDIFQPSQMKCLVTVKGIDLDCKRGFENSSDIELTNGVMKSTDVKVEHIFEMPEVSFEAKEYLDVAPKRNFDAMVTSTDSIESCSSSNPEFSKESRAG